MQQVDSSRHRGDHAVPTIHVDPGGLSRKWDVPRGAIGAGIAESDFGTAPGIRKALIDAISSERLTYLPSPLAERARSATTFYLKDRFAWLLDPEQVQIVPDVLSALRFAVTCFSPPGSPVIVPVPAYSPFLRIPGELGRDVITVPMIVVDGRWTLDLEALEHALSRGPATLVLCSPHNPLGAVPTFDELTAISRIVDAHGGRVFSDEIHASIVYSDRRHTPYASISDIAREHTVTATAASKGWNVPGLKSAQMLLSSEADLRRWQGQDLMPTHLGSILGAVAVTEAYSPAGLRWLDETVLQLERSRRTFISQIREHLPDAGFIPPEATYLGWLDLSGYTTVGVADLLAQYAGVYTTSGQETGREFGSCVRFNFATSVPTIEEAVRRMCVVLRDEHSS